MFSFDYQKWLNSKISSISNKISEHLQDSIIKNIDPSPANSAKSANQSSGISKISRNSSSIGLKNHQSVFHNKYDITILQIQKFLGDDWNLYKDNPDALFLWAEMLSRQDLLIALGVLKEKII